MLDGRWPSYPDLPMRAPVSDRIARNDIVQAGYRSGEANSKNLVV